MRAGWREETRQGASREADAMPTVRDLWAASAAKGGMEMTIEFEYDEHVNIVTAAFLERTRTPHASMPLVHRVDVLREYVSRGGWSTRKRRFFTHNDAPEWVRRISGGDYLVGIERIEWNDAEMRMYTVNESHAEKIVAEELCVIKKHPRDGDRTVKTLTVRARLCVRGWWTLGLSNLAERFLLGRYELLVQQGKKIELDEIERWRVSGRAESARRRLADAVHGRKGDARMDARRKETRAKEFGDSPVSTLARDASEAAMSVDTPDGLAVESLEAFERSLRSDSGKGGAGSAADATPAAAFAEARDFGRLREDEWLSMRYEGGFKTPPRSVETAPADPCCINDPDDPNDHNDPNDGNGTRMTDGSPPRDAAADIPTSAADLGTPGAAARRFLSPSSAADARALARRSASLKKRSLQKSLLLREKKTRETTTTKPNETETERRVDAETARGALGLKTAEERAAARSLAWRRAVVRFASCCALAAVAHERRDALEPLTSRLRRAAIAANRARARRAGQMGKEAKREASEASRDDAAEEVAFRRLGADAAADAEGEGVASVATRASAEA